MSDLLRDDELAWIEKGESTEGRCSSCGHLEIFHNGHCCEFCMVGDCLCEWGVVETKEDAMEYK